MLKSLTKVCTLQRQERQSEATYHHREKAEAINVSGGVEPRVIPRRASRPDSVMRQYTIYKGTQELLVSACEQTRLGQLRDSIAELLT